jgi:hypothetical protein
MGWTGCLWYGKERDKFGILLSFDVRTHERMDCTHLWGKEKCKILGELASMDGPYDTPTT